MNRNFYQALGPDNELISLITSYADAYDAAAWCGGGRVVDIRDASTVYAFAPDNEPPLYFAVLEYKLGRAYIQSVIWGWEPDRVGFDLAGARCAAAKLYEFASDFDNFGDVREYRVAIYDRETDELIEERRGWL